MIAFNNYDEAFDAARDFEPLSTGRFEDQVVGPGRIEVYEAFYESLIDLLKVVLHYRRGFCPAGDVVRHSDECSRLDPMSRFAELQRESWARST